MSNIAITHSQPTPFEASTNPLPDNEKHISGDQHSIEATDPEKPTEYDADGEVKQDGVRQVEAITTVWSKELLISMFILLYLVTFIDSLLQSVQANLVAYITSSFGQHGLLALTSILATIIGGVCNLTIAKIIDIWGRCEGFICMLVLVVVGIVMKATCTNVEMYAAANTIYWVGHIGLIYVISDRKSVV